MAQATEPKLPGALARAALDFASSGHYGQRRDADDLPYVMHPIEVAAMLHDCGYPDEVVAAGILHDVLEDTSAERLELERRFGVRVAALVATLTEDDSIRDARERKAALRRSIAEAGGSAAAIFAADKVSKAHELRLLAERGPLGDELELKLRHYEESLEMLDEVIPGHPLLARLSGELAGIRAMR